MTAASRQEVGDFMRVYRLMCPTLNQEVSVSAFADRLGWSRERTEAVALLLDEMGLIDTDRGLGTGVTLIEGQ